MKSAAFYSAFATASLVALNVFAQGSCHAGSNGQTSPYGQSSPYGQASPYGQPAPYDQPAPYGQMPYNPNLAPAGWNGSFGSPASPVTATAAAPKARITVIASEPQNVSAQIPSGPTARVTLLSDTTSGTSKIATIADSKTTTSPEPKVEDAPQLDAALKGLVGNWSAVARHGDGELTTVELQLDDRGWAKLTVPGTDGEPTTIKRRVELKDSELRLTGDSDVSLGKLVSFDARQMILERADGQVTFVRP